MTNIDVEQKIVERQYRCFVDDIQVGMARKLAALLTVPDVAEVVVLFPGRVDQNVEINGFYVQVTDDYRSELFENVVDQCAIWGVDPDKVQERFEVVVVILE